VQFLVAVVVGLLASVMVTFVLTFLDVPAATRGALSLATLVITFWLINRRDLSTESQGTDESKLPRL